jgi:8-amino-3,8-dideoxy-alpha-D-manno-octulosonate transaminase
MPGFEIFGDEERKEVANVLDTGVLFRYGFDQMRQGHWKAKTFEKELAQRLRVKHAHLCSSGTAALSIALAACGIGAGHEVIVPPFTFIATIEAVLMAGAVPVFADIDETLCLTAQTADAVISSRTKAILPVHMCGAMAQIDEIQRLCTERKLILIEDACQALGATFNQKALGTFGQIGCFSFDAVKTVTCGEGGAVVTEDDRLYGLVDGFSDHGHDHLGDDRGLETHPFLGLNYRISELNAAVGLAQFRKLDFMLTTQRRIKKAIKDTLAAKTDISFRHIPDEKGDSATFLTFLMPDRNKARKTVKALTQAGVDGCFYWYDNNWHYFRRWKHLQNLKSAAKLPLQLLANTPDYSALDLSASDAVLSRAISMQIKLSWTQAQLDERIERMVNVLTT